MKDSHKKAFMDCAERWAQESYCTRLKVGAIIVKDNRIISIGYNGTPSGWDNVCEYVPIGFTDSMTHKHVLHAEQNAIGKLARSNESGEDSIIFCTHLPCMECAKLIMSAGINTVYYKNEYRDTSSIEFFEKCNINIHKVE
jgi:dCMP deaminase